MRSLLAVLALQVAHGFRVRQKRGKVAGAFIGGEGAHEDSTQAAPKESSSGKTAGKESSGGKVVTIGDSFSSGTGTHDEGQDYDEEYGGYIPPWKFTDRSGNDCWRETDTTPGPMYAQANGMQSVFTACKGAEVPQIKNQLDYLASAYPADEAQKWNGSIILLTAGGNDIKAGAGTWTDVIIKCHLPFYNCNKKAENQVTNWASLQSSFVDLYTKLAVQASGARIRVLGYPRLMQRKGGRCWILPTLSRQELDWIDDLCDQLNAVIASAMSTVRAMYPQVDMEYVSVLNYLTNGACENSKTREVNDEVFDGFLSISDSSFHPTLKGYRKYYDALTDSL